MNRPHGTVSFLFTDVEGSTRLWQEHPQQMDVALARHDVIVRETIAAHGGYVFSSAGDGIGASFARATDAANAAATIQRLLTLEPWPGDVSLRVRMGIHTGEAIERAGDYFGPAVNRAARIMAAGHGGQVLVSGTTARVLDGSTVSLLDVGEHELRDLDGVEHLYQIVGDGLPLQFAPIRSLDVARGRLPSHRSSFIGRDEEVATVRELLHGGRLVTLCGAGGSGKTRLAIEVAARIISATPDGVYFVDLSRATGGDSVAEAFAAALDFVADSAVGVAKQVRERLGHKRVLLVVDNCEHVLEAVADEVDAILAVCPRVRILATSREALGIDGEHAYRVPSLAVVSDNGRPPSVRLFLERAADIGVDLGGGSDALLTDICRRLDGLPLAIELAAARAGVLSPAQILDRLDNRFALLTGGRRSTRPRRQTLEATISWSYDLLDAGEQEALRRLSVMAGAFDVDLSSAVMERGEQETLDVLDRLIAKSLLQPVRADGPSQVRYRLLETIRAFARERLIDAGEEASTGDLHARHIADRLEAIPGMPLSLLPEHELLADDVMAALEWVHARNNVDLGARLSCGATPMFVGLGRIPHGQAMLEWAAQAGDGLLRSKTFVCRSWVEMAAGTGADVRFAGLSLKAAGEAAVPWRTRAHVIRANTFSFVNPEAAAEEIRSGREAARNPATVVGDVGWLDYAEACLSVARRDYRAAVVVSDRGLAHLDLDPIILALLHAGRLLALTLDEDRESVDADLQEPAIASMRATWLASAHRGEHWFVGYEVIRAVASAFCGHHDRARQDLAGTLALLGSDHLPGLDADFLGAFAMICVYAGERQRAAAMLDGTWTSGRTPMSTFLLLEALEGAHGMPDGDITHARLEELTRRLLLRDAIMNEDRTRRMLDDEVARLALGF